MSDVPELDRLIDEHENYRHNMAWNRREEAFVMTMRVGITVMVAAALIGVVGGAGAIAAPAVWGFAAMSIPKPQRRDPFKRYRAM